MRTLFLIGILTILVIIATKKPNQTAWEAAEGFAENAKVAIGDIRDGSNPMGEKNFANQVEDALSEIKLNKPVESAKDDKKVKVKNISKNKVPVPPTSKLASSQSEVSSNNEEKWKLPSAMVTEVPKLPAIPKSPVVVTEINGEVPPSGQRAPSMKGYGEVRSFYENANRLLQEIK